MIIFNGIRCVSTNYKIKKKNTHTHYAMQYKSKINVYAFGLVCNDECVFVIKRCVSACVCVCVSIAKHDCSIYTRTRTQTKQTRSNKRTKIKKKILKNEENYKYNSMKF